MKLRQEKIKEIIGLKTQISQYTLENCIVKFRFQKYQTKNDLETQIREHDKDF